MTKNKQLVCQHRNFETVGADFDLPIKIQEATNPDRVLRFKMSDESLDRHGEVILQSGWDFSEFVENPVCMAFHDYNQWPLGKGIAVGVVDGAAYIDMEFDPKEVDERADVVFRKVVHGTIKAGSVGFIRKVWADVTDPSHKELFKGFPGASRIYKEQSLLEWTICPIGANKNALVELMAKRFGAEPIADTGSDCLDWSAIEAKIERNIQTMKG